MPRWRWDEKGWSVSDTSAPNGLENGLAFDRLDAALPLPVLKEWRDLLPYVDQLKDLILTGSRCLD